MITKKPSPDNTKERKIRFEDAKHMQMMEGNPLDEEDLKMFAMFEEKGWSYEKREKYIIEQVKKASLEKANKLNKDNEEFGGQEGPDPTRFGDWEKGGRCSDF